MPPINPLLHYSCCSCETAWKKAAAAAATTTSKQKEVSFAHTADRAYIIIYSIQFDSIRYTQVLCTPRTKTSIFFLSSYEFICPSARNVTNIINTTFVPAARFLLLAFLSFFARTFTKIVLRWCYFFVHSFRLLCKHTHSSCVIENFRLDTVLLLSKVKTKKGIEKTEENGNWHEASVALHEINYLLWLNIHNKIVQQFTHKIHKIFNETIEQWDWIYHGMLACRAYEIDKAHSPLNTALNSFVSIFIFSSKRWREKTIESICTQSYILFRTHALKRKLLPETTICDPTRPHHHDDDDECSNKDKQK